MFSSPKAFFFSNLEKILRGRSVSSNHDMCMRFVFCHGSKSSNCGLLGCDII
jgi:hypothetical protein